MDMTDRALHMRCSLKQIAPCSNGLCKKDTLAPMHETARRLLAIGKAKGAKDFTEIAKALGGSDQSATNWKARGVPQRVIVKAATMFGADPGWISLDPGAKEPQFVTAWIRGGEAPKALTFLAQPEPPGYCVAPGDEFGEQATQPAKTAMVAPINNGRNAEIAEVVAMMERTDDKGRTLALGAVKGALANYGHTIKKSCEIIDLRKWRRIRLRATVEGDH